MDICKEAEVKASGEVRAEDLEQINALSRRALKAEEVYTFAVRLCDNEIDREMSLATAAGWGLERVQELLTYRPVSDSADSRGPALAALLRIGGDSFTRAAINDTLSGCGINAYAAEGSQPGYVEVSFPDVKGIPAAFEELRAIIEEILPCHLEITYLFWFNSWADVAALFPTWGGAEAENVTWHELSVWRE